MACLALAAVAWLASVPALDAGWLWDDRLVINRQLPLLDTPGRAFFPPADVPNLAPEFYRPLIVLSWQADAALAGRSAPSELSAGLARAFHRTNLLAHALCSALVFLLGRLLARRGGFSLWASGTCGAAAGVLFAVHPIHAESVTWAAGRSDLFMAAFALAGLLFWLRWLDRDSLPAGGGAALCFLAALLCKEAALGFLLLPLALAAGTPSPHPEKTPRGNRRLAAAAFLLFPALSFWVLRSLAFGGGPRLFFQPSGNFLLDPLAALGWYFRKSVWPGEPTVFLTAPGGKGEILIGLAVLAGIAFACRPAGWKPESSWLAVNALLFLGPLLPALAYMVGKLGPVAVADRNLYLPSAAACLLGAIVPAALGRRFFPGRSWTPWLPVVVALILAAGAWNPLRERIALWSDEVRFWKLGVEQSPEALLPRASYGLALDRNGRTLEAIEAFRSALEKPKTPRQSGVVSGYLGNALLTAKRIEEAIPALEESVRLEGTDPVVLYNLGHALALASGKAGSAEEKFSLLNRSASALKRAIDLDPDYIKALFHYGDVLVQLGQTESGLAFLRRGLEIDPEHPQASLARRLIDRLGEKAQ